MTVRCGSDALAEYRALREDEKSLSNLFSAPRGQIFPVAEKLQKDYADLRRAYGRAGKENALLRLEALPACEGNLCLVLPDADADTLRAAANGGIEKCTGVFVALSGNDAEGYRYVISARGGLRAMTKAINGALNGRGGGSDVMIQGSFNASEQIICDYFKEFQI